MFVKIFRVSAEEGINNKSKLVEFSTQKLFEIRSGVIGGEGERRNEFTEWHVVWLAE